mgnify:CR=1 FL=1
MKFSIRGAAAAIGVASMLAAASVVPAQAGGSAFAGGLIGGIIGGAIANSAPPRYAPAPVYVAPRCVWQKQKVWDPYVGWVWRNVQVCG